MIFLVESTIIKYVVRNVVNGVGAMLEQELTQIAKEFLKENYGLQLTIPIKRNNRLRSTHGRFIIRHDQTPLQIEIAGKTIDYGTTDAIIGVLKHECIHFALHMQGKPSRDGHPYFEAELHKHGAPSTNTMIIGKHYIFTCNKCGREYESRRKQLVNTPSKYRTKCCKAKLTVIGERIYDGT